MRLRTLSQVAEDWVEQALLCYDMEPASLGRMKKLHDTAKGRALRDLRAEAAPAAVRSALFGYVEEQYLSFHSKTKRMIKCPQLMSIRKHGARKVSS